MPVENHLESRVWLVGILVHALGGQCIVDVHEGDNLCGDADLITLEPVGIAFSVILFMMVSGDIIRVLIDCAVIQANPVLNDFGTLGGVGFDELKFIGCQLAGF